MASINPEIIERKIYLIREHKVLLDEDLAILYQVETRILTRAIQRNLERFPSDFMFQLSEQEVISLRSQIGISKEGRGGRRYLPYVFTEQGVSMLSAVLKSPTAVAVSIEIVRTFIRMRNLLTLDQELAQKLSTLERKYDYQFKVVFDAIREIMNPEVPPKKRQIGFGTAIQTISPTNIRVPKLSYELFVYRVGRLKLRNSIKILKCF